MKDFSLKSYHLLVIICVAVWICQLTLPGFTEQVQLSSSTFSERPWTLLTAMFAHAPQFLHIFLNMLSLWYVGKAVESRYPWWWFFVTYMVGGLTGNLVWLLAGPADPVVGASGAIFAILGMALPLTRFHWSVLLLAGLNVAISFAVPHVAWQVHLGGMAVGLVFGSLFAAYIVKHNRRMVAQQPEPIWPL